MGRKKQKTTEALYVRVTPEQHSALEAEALRRSVPVAAIIREMVEARYQSAAAK